MRALLRLVLFRQLRAARGRVALTALGIVLGVAVVFAVQVVNASVLGAFNHSVSDVSGKAKLSVGAAVGVEEDVLERVRAVDGVQAAVPIIELSVRDVHAHAQLALLALDTLSDPTARGQEIGSEDVQVADVMAFLNDPHGVLVTRAYAKRTGVRVGDTLLLDTPQGRSEFRIHGMLEPRGVATVYGGDMLLMDVYAAQVAFDRPRRFDRIDVIPDAGVDASALANRIARALDYKVPVSRPERRNAEAKRLLAGFRLALSLASLVAVFVGGFIIYNSLAIAVAQRRRDIGILRALGTTRTQVLTLFLIEGFLIGSVGAVVGLLFGVLLARGSLGLVEATVSALYLPVRVNEIVVPAQAAWTALLLGVTAAVVAAFVPARRAASIDPVSAMSRTVQEADVAVASSSASLRILSVAIFLTVVAASVAHAYQQSALAFAVAGLLSLTAAFVAPLVAAGVGYVAQRYAKRVGPAALLGAMAFARNRGRNAVSTAALGMALANVVNVDTLIDSLKGTTDAWLGRSFRADVFVFAGTEVHAKFEHPLPESLRGELHALANVEFVQAFRMVQRSFKGQPFYLMSEDFEGYHRYNELAVTAGTLSEAEPQLEAGTGIAASEAFARSFHVGLGDSVTLDTPTGPRPFRIALIYTDYRADVGILFTTRSAYKRIFRDDLVDLYSVYLTTGASLESARTQISERFGARYGLMALGSTQYKRDLVGLVDRSMALSRATELVAVVVAGLGIVISMFVGVFDRRREIGLLKALGTARVQLDRVVLIEALLIACSAALLGLLLGTALSAYMVLEALRIEVGWGITLHLSAWVYAEAFALALPIAWLAARWPMGWAGRLEIVEALQHE